jgi:hypothetical protein
MLDQKLAVVGRHFTIVLAGDGLARLFRPLLEHLGLLAENRCVCHGSLSSYGALLRDQSALAQRMIGPNGFTIR